jgi:hypothetical protein
MTLSLSLEQMIQIKAKFPHSSQLSNFWSLCISWWTSLITNCSQAISYISTWWLLYPRSPKGEGGILFYICPSVQDSFRRIFLSNCWWQKSDIWSQASYRYTILWVAFLDPSDSYFLFADLVDLYTHWTYMHIFRHIFLSNYWWQRSDIWSQASYRYPISWEAFLDPSDSYFLFADLVGFYTHWTYMHIFCHIFLSNYWWQKSDIWLQASYRYPISGEAFLDPSDSYFLFADFVDFYTHLTYICICTFFVAFFSATIDDRNLIFGHKFHIGMPYCGKRFWTRQIPTSCLPT